MTQLTISAFPSLVENTNRKLRKFDSRHPEKEKKLAYHGVEISEKLLSDTRGAWELIVGSDEFAIEYGTLFDWIQAHRDYTVKNGGTSTAYALVQEGHQTASAFIEVISSDNKGGLTKLLKVFISPQYWDIPDHQTDVVRLFSASILEVVRISRNNNSRTFKIYGRTPELLSLLHSLHVAMMKDDLVPPGVTVSMTGRWLEVSC